MAPSRMSCALKSAPDIRVMSAGLHPPFVHLVVRTVVPLRVGPQTRRCTAMKWVHHHPRGPRSGPGYRVPVRHHLIDPIRPTHGHTAISPHGGLYAMPSLCGSAEATRAWFRAFADCSVLTCRPLRPRGAHHRDASRLQRRRHGLRHRLTGSTLPTLPQSDPRGRSISWLHWFAFATACQIARLPVGSNRDTAPAHGDFYVQAFDGSVILPAAGYHYDIDWTPMSAGLAPAGTAASFAALARMSADRMSLSLRRRLTLDAVIEGYPDGPGRASSKEGES
jgi:hypothetical protein